MTKLTNAQADAAEEIKTLVTASDAAVLEAIEKALEAGRRLVSAKDDCAHGTWLPFLTRAGVPERKAQRLMKLARSGLKSDTVSLLGGVTNTLKWIALRDEGVAHFDGALLDIQKGGTGIACLEKSIATMDAMVLMFPEDQREALRPRPAAEQSIILIERLADLRAA